MGAKRVEVRVSGRVQGVSFRYYTRLRAQELGLSGWVRNESNGDVLAVAEGDEDSLAEFLDFVKVGPNHAQVESCQTTWKDATGEFQEFRVRR